MSAVSGGGSAASVDQGPPSELGDPPLVGGLAAAVSGVAEVLPGCAALALGDGRPPDDFVGEFTQLDGVGQGRRPVNGGPLVERELLKRGVHEPPKGVGVGDESLVGRHEGAGVGVSSLVMLSRYP